MTIGFVASCIAELTPSLKDIISEVDKKTLQDHVDICYEEGLKRWCASSIVRERIALKKFANIIQLQELYKSEEWGRYKYAVKSLAESWADELEKDFDCVKFIQQYEKQMNNYNR